MVGEVEVEEVEGVEVVAVVEWWQRRRGGEVRLGPGWVTRVFPGHVATHSPQQRYLDASRNTEERCSIIGM